MLLIFHTLFPRSRIRQFPMAGCVFAASMQCYYTYIAAHHTVWLAFLICLYGLMIPIGFFFAPPGGIPACPHCYRTRSTYRTVVLSPLTISKHKGFLPI
ncbi:hypothetical protein QBC41DRAFT_115586 [Cercophora samala]|uniref:Uncharacterized protein n=1 Tax=Cercophora samala TaxID=330535 RepID=A0AA39ZM21_9PEZI|nr:hypothetical protein QBC41DRAFT_115586 [Cercophora samala]